MVKYATTRKKDFYVRSVRPDIFSLSSGTRVNPKPSFMKKSLVLLLISSLVSGLYARQPRTVVEPPFAFRNSGTLEIERIRARARIDDRLHPSLFPTSQLDTNQLGNLYPHRRRRRKADSPLGRRHAARHRVLHARDGTARLLARAFLPVDPKTAKIDLIESDCPDCFKIYDIDLTGKKAKPGRSALAKKYKKAAPLTENFTAPVVSDSPARIAGAITGYDTPLFRPDRNRVLLSDRRGRSDRTLRARPGGRIVRNGAEHPHADTRDALSARIRHPSVLCRARAGDRAGDRSGSSIP